MKVVSCAAVRLATPAALRVKASGGSAGTPVAVS